MNAVQALADAYRRHVRLTWEGSLAGPQRVWFAVYEPTQERRLRFRLGDFRDATVATGHSWHEVDLAYAFGAWLDGEEYRDEYFANPEYLDSVLPELADRLAATVVAGLAADGVDEGTVVALLGVGALFGLGQLRVSALIERVAPDIRGRLLVFFPGEHTGNSYRLYGAGDGWNYLAVPITA